MTKNVSLPCAGEYAIMEGATRIDLDLGLNTDPLVFERIDFRESFFNEYIYRIATAITKIKLITDALHEHNEYKNTKFSGLITLENDILEDAFSYNLLLLAETVNAFATEFPMAAAKFLTIFNKIQETAESLEFDIESYNLSYNRLFSNQINNTENFKRNKFKSVSKKIFNANKQLFVFRNKVLAHIKDPNRFEIQLSFQEYLDTIDLIKIILDDISLICSFRINEWGSFHTEADLKRTREWLIKGLLASL